MCSGSDPWQMTMWQPAAVASRAAVSLVAIPPVPHCVPGTLVSTYTSHASAGATASGHAIPTGVQLTDVTLQIAAACQRRAGACGMMKDRYGLGCRVPERVGIQQAGRCVLTCRAAMSCTSWMGFAEGSVDGLAVNRLGTSVRRNSQSARTNVATWHKTQTHEPTNTICRVLCRPLRLPARKLPAINMQARNCLPGQRVCHCRQFAVPQQPLCHSH